MTDVDGRVFEWMPELPEHFLDAQWIGVRRKLRFQLIHLL